MMSYALVTLLFGVTLASSIEENLLEDNSTSPVQRSKLPVRSAWFGPSFKPRWYDESSVITRSDVHFGYEPPKGAETWPNQFPNDCGKRRQSPINLQTSELLDRKAEQALYWVNYDNMATKYELENSGHSVHVTGNWDDLYRPYITGGPLNGDYELSQIHFHWAGNNARGSEHTINGQRFPLEMHVVHSKVNAYDDATDNGFSDKPDNIAVVGFVFQITPQDNPALGPMIEGIPKVRNMQGQKVPRVRNSANAKTEIAPIDLLKLIIPFQSNYVTYEGSLTTPPCSETVKWIFCAQRLSISQRQLNVIRTAIRTQSGRPFHNYRPIQSVNNREIFYLR